MQTISLGRTGMEISKIGFGGIPIQRLTEEQAIGVIRHALNCGINWIDTANGYGDSETKIGQALKGLDRSTVHLFSKAGGRDPVTLKEQIELSLERLQADYLDLYQCHIVPDLETWQTMQDNGTLDLLADFRSQGVIRHIGASSHSRETMLKVIEHPLIETAQWPFNFIVEEDALVVLEKCRAFETGLIAMKPFGGGMLGTASVCIRYLLQYEDIAADPGFETRKEITEVAALADEAAPLTSDDCAAMAEIKATLGARFCRRCGYCSPCPQGVSIVTLMTFESLLKRFPRERVMTGWPADGIKTFAQCTECGECEGKCPYGLPIREVIRESHGRFSELSSS